MSVLVVSTVKIGSRGLPSATESMVEDAHKEAEVQWPSSSKYADEFSHNH